MLGCHVAKAAPKQLLGIEALFFSFVGRAEIGDVKAPAIFGADDVLQGEVSVDERWIKLVQVTHGHQELIDDPHDIGLCIASL